jgi:Ca2+-binding RTX toxin-like protein
LICPEVDKKILLPTLIDGGDGKDKLQGGGHNILIGGAGDDKLKGGDNRDLLISGVGRDKLEGIRS